MLRMFLLLFIILISTACSELEMDKIKCNVNADCPKNTVCKNRSCVDDTSECKINSDCKDTTKPVCDNGICVADSGSCTEGKTKCNELGNVEVCNIHGKWEELRICSENQECQEVVSMGIAHYDCVCKEDFKPDINGDCVPADECTDGKKMCRENKAMECSAGDWNLLDDCSPEGMLCRDPNGNAPRCYEKCNTSDTYKCLKIAGKDEVVQECKNGEYWVMKEICKDGKICDAELHKCVEDIKTCHTNSECPVNEVCNTSSYECECPAGYHTDYLDENKCKLNRSDGCIYKNKDDERCNLAGELERCECKTGDCSVIPENQEDPSWGHWVKIDCGNNEICKYIETMNNIPACYLPCSTENDKKCSSDEYGIETCENKVWVTETTCQGATPYCYKNSPGDFSCVECRNDGDCNTGDVCNSQNECVRKKEWTDISVGGNHTCGIKEGMLYCWGDNMFGQLGKSETGFLFRTPQHILLDNGEINDAWMKVSAGKTHTCAILQDGDNNFLYCWGRNDYGQLGIGTMYGDIDGCINDTNDKKCTKPIKITSSVNKWTDISVGDGYSCGVNNKELYCWGHNNNGQLGLGTDTTSKYIPVNVIVESANFRVKKVATSLEHTCAINITGKVFCWGNNTHSKLGKINITNPHLPNLVGTINEKPWTVISLGADVSCGILNLKTYCWGSNMSGQLGANLNNSSVSEREFTLANHVLNSSGVGVNLNDISIGYHYACGILTNIQDTNTLMCWGSNGNSNEKKFGDNSLVGMNYIYAIGADFNARKISLNRFQENAHSCAIDNSGQLYCWGNNYHGQIGTGTTINYYIDRQQVIINQ